MDDSTSFWADADTLAANADGRLTPRQYERMARSSRQRRRAGLDAPTIASGIGEIRPPGKGHVIAVPEVQIYRQLRRSIRGIVAGVTIAVPFGLAFVATVPAILWATLRDHAYAHALLALLPAGAVAVFVGGINDAVRDARAPWAALAAPAPVLRAEGPVTILEDEGHYQLAVGTVELPVCDRVARAFVHGMPYPLYDLARPARLAAEPSSAAESTAAAEPTRPVEPADS